MIAIVLILAASIGGSVIFGKKLHETLPIAVFTVTLAVYAFALVLPLPAAVYICAGITLSVCVAAFIVRRRRSGGIERGMWNRIVEPTVILTLVLTCTVFCFLMADRHVFFFDDLSYWALYTKNIFCIDRLPYVYENCTVSYKDYTPIMQILQYLAMFGSDTFRESIMFQVNVCFVYIMLLPLIAAGYRAGSSNLTCRFIRILSVIMYVIFPHILTAQFYYRLGVDLFLALVFGYILYYILTDEENGLFRMIAIVSAISFLALIKTSGIVLCIFAIVIFLIKELQHKRIAITILKTGIISVFAVGAYMTWQLFLHYSGNNGYLSDRVKDRITGGGVTLPEYTGEVVRNYIHHFVFYPLTRGRIGVTALLITVFILLAYVVSRREMRTSKRTIPFGIAVFCFILFCVAHICMYLFVFDEWEAHGLLEYDRYISQYLGGLLYVAVIMLTEWTEENVRPRLILLACSTIVFIALLPYADMRRFLVPSNYQGFYEENYDQLVDKVESEWEQSGIADMDLPHDGSARITVVADAWDDSSQFLEYTMVPQPIDAFINVPAISEGELKGFIEGHHEQYVYVSKNAEKSYAGDWSETSGLTKDGQPLECGVLYVTERNGEAKTLVKVEK